MKNLITGWDINRDECGESYGSTSYGHFVKDAHINNPIQMNGNNLPLEDIYR